jgi:hypothetical protein
MRLEGVVGWSLRPAVFSLLLTAIVDGFLKTPKNFFYNERLFLVLGIIVGVAALIGGTLYLLEHNINDKNYRYCYHNCKKGESHDER